MNKICSYFYWFGWFVFTAAVLNLRFKLFDVGISYVLLPMSFAFILMIIMIDKLWFKGVD
jgi:hypothetical protein